MSKVSVDTRLEQLKNAIDYKIDNLVLSLHVQFVKNNNIEQTIQNAYDFIYTKIYELFLQSINDLEWDEIKPKIQETIHQLIRYWSL